MRAYDFKCDTCGKTELIVDTNSPEVPTCCEIKMREYVYSVPHSASLHSSERPVIFENPQTGEVRYPATPNSPMMPGYKERGFERREFNSYQEHKKWCDGHGVVNHQVEGIRDEA